MSDVVHDNAAYFLVLLPFIVAVVPYLCIEVYEWWKGKDDD